MATPPSTSLYARVLVEEFDADVNAGSNDGYTPLHIAAEFGHHETVSVLTRGRTGVAINARQDGDVARGNLPLSTLQHSMGTTI